MTLVVRSGREFGFLPDEPVINVLLPGVDIVGGSGGHSG
jgi:hypothetical protein